MTQAVLFLNDFSCSEKLAVWTVRRLAGRQAPACPHGPADARGLYVPGLRREFDGVARAFRKGVARMADTGIGGLDVGMTGQQAVSRTEGRFLEAIAAAQNEDDAGVRGALRPVFPHRYVQSRFAAAVTLLGACLAVAGHWLPRRREAPPVTAPAPRPHIVGAGCLGAMARWHELDMGMTHVLWPRAGRSPTFRTEMRGS
ncbi:hypothetical protein AA13595_1209 [Gluconacetobacter johannae DSM 13595]|uniref:Uncharacterized protein n=1 Tax=Gluconacetobacter johannae TaxID=112140 RepID=A0A7W4J6D6_9PROT|nr:hypothetical protein [Gluconacetobacter johannae]MBB2175578.1 hypothetical protein [Gluconacetobacter johannae]GBQ83582.1 hypothetical protein AA13595_1209 [Gluconacetobacter johannae DSM 13595]